MDKIILALSFTQLKEIYEKVEKLHGTPGHSHTMFLEQSDTGTLSLTLAGDEPGADSVTLLTRN